MPRTTCASFLEMALRAAPFFEEVVRWHALGADLIGGKLAFSQRYNIGMSPALRRQLKANEPQSVGDHINLWLQAQVAVGGPKVFKPTLDQCLAMEQVAPRIAIRDYAQPYPVMVIDLPETYQKQRTCPLGSAGGVTTAHAPTCVLVGTYGDPPWTIWLNLVFDSGIGVQWALLPTDATIEEGIVREFGPASYVPADLPADPIGSEERLVVAGLLRLAVNAMLLLADFGCKHLGAVNPSHHRRLEHFVKAAGKRGGRGLDQARRQLRLSAQLYGFPQDIVLHDEEARTAEAVDPSEPHEHRRPHWRRGHWKTHAHGPGRAERKRLFIKPVLVNRHLLRGDDGPPETTYRVR